MTEEQEKRLEKLREACGTPGNWPTLTIARELLSMVDTLRVELARASGELRMTQERIERARLAWKNRTPFGPYTHGCGLDDVDEAEMNAALTPSPSAGRLFEAARQMPGSILVSPTPVQPTPPETFTRDGETNDLAAEITRAVGRFLYLDARHMDVFEAVKAALDSGKEGAR